jgi:hypothetical protein
VSDFSSSRCTLRIAAAFCSFICDFVIVVGALWAASVLIFASLITTYDSSPVESRTPSFLSARDGTTEVSFLSFFGMDEGDGIGLEVVLERGEEGVESDEESDDGGDAEGDGEEVVNEEGGDFVTVAADVAETVAADGVTTPLTCCVVDGALVAGDDTDTEELFPRNVSPFAMPRRASN